MAGEEEELEMEDVGEEARRPRLIPTPVMPQAWEVEEHNAMGHVQYRSWCQHCVAARGVGQRHTQGLKMMSLIPNRRSSVTTAT